MVEYLYQGGSMAAIQEQRTPSVEELQAILKSIPDLFFRVDSNGIILDYHCHNVADLPAPPDQITGRAYLDVIPEHLRTAFRETMSEVSRSRKPVQIEYSLQSQGREKYFETRILNVFENQFVFLTRNITERKRTESALRQANERFLLASSAVNSAIYDWHIEENTIVWNNGLTDVFHFPGSISETTDQWWAELIHPEDRSEVLEKIASRMMDEQDFVVEYRLRNGKGEFRNVEDRGRLLRDSEGSIVRVVGSVIDITDRKLAEKAIRESEKRYRGLVETMNEFVTEMKTDGTFTFVNQPFLKSTGYTIDEVINTNFFDLIHLEDLDSTREQSKILLEQGRPLCYLEYRFRKKNGHYMSLLTSADPMPDGQGNIHSVLHVSFDITERKQAEESLHLMMEIIATASEAEDNRVVTAQCLEKICRLGGWQLGQAWFVDERDNTLFCSHAFFSELELTEFRKESVQLRLPQGSGLAGRVWADLKPIWLTDISRNPEFLRSSSAQRCGLQTAFAFPVANDGRLQAIFEFFSTELLEPSEQMLSLATRLGSHLGVVFDRKQEKERLRYQAYHDVLTGLPNRTLLEDRFTVALAHSRRNQLMLAVLFLDLDRFKNINDKLGHHTGDALLRGVSQRFTHCVREVDTIARLGGDEFVILLPDLQNIQDAPKIAQKLLMCLEEPFLIEGQELHTTTSIGICLYPHDGDDLSTLMRNADAALYRAKEKGRNNYQLYAATMTLTALARLKVERDLRHALSKQELLLYYQPQFDIQSGKVIGIEALIRWTHPEMGLFLPAEFLSSMEDTSLLLPIWEWALRKACVQLRRWRDASIVAPLITMNIPPQLHQITDLYRIITEAITSARLEPRDLELEIAQGPRTLDNSDLLRELKSTGIRIALDDFGSGSSFLEVKRFPLDTIKIDPLFIQGLSTNQSDRAIVASIISLAHGMNLRVIAEAVEQPEQLSFLKVNQCDGVQGFLFCRPLPAESLTGFLQQGLANL